MKRNTHMIIAIGAFVVLIGHTVLWIKHGFSVGALLGIISMVLLIVAMILSMKQRK